MAPLVTFRRTILTELNRRAPVEGQPSAPTSAPLRFDSPTYLGLSHSSSSLVPWSELMDEEGRETQRETANAIAELQSCEAGILAPSSLHLFIDFLGLIQPGHFEIYAEETLYPVARWGIERAASNGASVNTFRHLDADDLSRKLKQAKTKPLVLANGLCTGCGEPSPVSEYLQCAEQYDGRLLLDDTQALGILGHSPSEVAPYGKGGGGVLRWSGVEPHHVLVISSLAKGFGAPVAVFSGTRHDVERFEAASETLRYCSPPSSAALSAAERALIMNGEQGDPIRVRLASLVRRFRQQVLSIGLSVYGGIFPVQTLGAISGHSPSDLYHRLYKEGVRTILARDPTAGVSRVVFCLTARHQNEDIDSAVLSLREATTT